MTGINRRNEAGAVSIFVVILAMLIITVMTVSFLRLMTADLTQAGDNDLSQSAYDSAQAGVEDAKRALLRYQQVCSSTLSPATCTTLSDELSSNQCNYGVSLGGVAIPEGLTDAPRRYGEVKVQQTVRVDRQLDQAYTCVKMQLQTQDYIGSLAPGESKLIPLVSRTPFNSVTVRWYSGEDLTNNAGTVSLPTTVSTMPSQTSYNPDRPSIMRAQLVQFGETFTMEGFDTMTSNGTTTESNANTVFLYPISGVGSTSSSFSALDARRANPGEETPQDTPSTTPHGVRCQTTIASGGYACSMTLSLPTPVGGSDANRTAFLRLAPYYNATHFQVILSNGDPATPSNIQRFDGVQPIVDSTGRANDMFRRIESRVELYNTNFPYPEGTIDITKNFCKNFAVSDDPNTYRDTVTACTP